MGCYGWMDNIGMCDVCMGCVKQVSGIWIGGFIEK